GRRPGRPRSRSHGARGAADAGRRTGGAGLGAEMTARRVRGLAAAAFALATIAHLVFWYAPRERAASPGRLAAELEAPDVEFGTWLAHPHQNLAALARRVDDPRRWAARLSGREVDVVPAFGPFLVPP